MQKMPGIQLYLDSVKAPIQSGEIHVWKVSLAEAGAWEDDLSLYLSEEELAKAQRFVFEKDRNHYRLAHALLRQILGKYLSRQPQQLHFAYNQYGKPHIPAQPGCPHVAFSLSYSGQMMMVAIDAHRSIGIDIEYKHRRLEMERIARSFFSEAEIQMVQPAAGSLCSDSFFQIWSRKEAVLKAMGTGLSFPMEKLDTSRSRENTFSQVVFSGNAESSPPWYVQDLPVGNDYAAAVAVAGGGGKLVLWNCR